MGIDTGAMYRATTLYFLQNNVDLENKEAVNDSLDNLNIDFRFNKELQKSETYLNSKNVENEIRTMYISEKVSIVSTIKEVREAMVSQQKKMGKEKAVVLDGRDIG